MIRAAGLGKKPVDAAGPHELSLGANGTACEWGEVILQVDPWPPARLEAMRQSTGKDWEGAGIAPDVAVDPKQALVLALEKAGLSHEEAVRLDAQELPAEPVHSDKLRAR